MSASPSRGHAFISYVHENDEQVDALCSFLEAAGISVWRDRDELWPGDDWKIYIKRAIQRDALAFIACFSKESMDKSRSYQNEELNLAIEEYRMRPPGQPWIFPVRFGDVELPEYELAPGKTLESLQWTDLFGEKRDPGLARLAVSISRVIGGPLNQSAEPSSPSEVPTPVSGPSEATPTATAPVTDDSEILQSANVVARVKILVRDASKDIELDDFVTELSDDARQKCLDSITFPTSSDELRTDFSAAEYVINRVDQYWDIVRPLSEALATGCAWGSRGQDPLWSRAMQTIANITPMIGGNNLLLSLRCYPRIMVMYAAGLGAVYRNNYSALKAVTVDAKYRDFGQLIPVIGVDHPWKPWSGAEYLANVVAWHTAGEEITEGRIDGVRRRGGGRVTPVSDDLHGRLRNPLKPLIRVDNDYDEYFDKLEVMLGLIGADVAAQERNKKLYLPGGWAGRYVWRSRHGRSALQEASDEFASQQASWPPLRAGLFSGSAEQAERAFAAMSEVISRTRTF
jgi:TIR domain